MTRARDVATQGGLVLLNKTTVSAASSVTINNVFSSVYNNYRMMVWNSAASAQSTLALQFSTGGTPTTTGYYYGFHGFAFNGNTSFFRAGNAAQGGFAFWDADIYSKATVFLDIFNPFRNLSTYYQGIHNSESTVYNWGGGGVNNTTSYDGLKILTTAGTFTGEIQIYGYKV